MKSLLKRTRLIGLALCIIPALIPAQELGVTPEHQRSIAEDYAAQAERRAEEAQLHAEHARQEAIERVLEQIRENRSMPEEIRREILEDLERELVAMPNLPHVPVPPHDMELLHRELPFVIERFHKQQQILEEQLPGPEFTREMNNLQRDMGRIARDYREVHRHLGKDSELFKAEVELNIRADELVREWHEAEDDEEREEIRKNLNTVLEKAFGVSLQLREAEAREVESELEQLWSLIEKRRENRDVIIERRMTQLLENEDPLAW